MEAIGAKRRARQTLEELETLMRRDVQAYLELASDYMNWGLGAEAIGVLERASSNKTDSAGTYPLVYYYLGYLHEQKGDRAAADDLYDLAARMPSDYCFPFRPESMTVLAAAIAARPGDARAHHYLGSALYELQPEQAISHWEQAAKLDATFAPSHRNLGWAYYRTTDDIPKAIASYEKAVACEGKDARLISELDRLYELGNTAPQVRLDMLREHHATVVKRNDSFTREIMTMVLTGHYDGAIEYLTKNHFHVAEGGGGIHDIYVDAYLLRGIARLRKGEANAALDDFLAAHEYPENLSVGRPQNDPRAAQLAYYTARAYEALGNQEKAKAYDEKSAEQEGSRRWPEARYYRALSMAELGRDEQAKAIFEDLIEEGTRRIERGEDADFFAKFGEQQARQVRLASAHYLVGLGHLGLGRDEKAREEFEQATKFNVSHVWAGAELAALED
jgi:tetratricopeptide (TPR) repeat protein